MIDLILKIMDIVLICFLAYLILGIIAGIIISAAESRKEKGS